MLERVVAFGLLLFACCSPAIALEMRVVPGPTILLGDPVGIQVTGADAGERIVLEAERASVAAEGVSLQRSRAEYVADADGAIDTRASSAIAGDFTGVDEAGLFWSMRPVDGEPRALGAEEVRVVARTADGDTAEAVIRMLDADPRVVSRPAEGFPGAVLYRIDDQARRPAIIVLGGSEGGSGHARFIGPALASRGYAVLGLPYYAPPWGSGKIEGLSDSFIDIRIELLAEARDWLLTQSDVDARRVGIWGVSKGAEFALLGASRYAWIAATAAIVPSDVVWEGWGPASRGPAKDSSFSWQGQPLPFVPYGDADLYFGAFARGQRPTITLADVHRRGRAANLDRVGAARIPIEQYRGALLVAGGGEDTVWPSAEMAAAIADRRAAAGLTTIAIVQPAAGHGLGAPGFEPTGAYGSGGSPQANGRAQVEVWRAALAMFSEELAPPPTN